MAKDQKPEPEEQEKRPLTLSDPISPTELERLNELDMAKQAMALRNMDLDQEKIQLQAAVRRADKEMKELLSSILIARGQSPDAIVDVNQKTGILRVREPENAEG